MTDRIPSDVAEARLNHLIDRARRGALLPAEADQFTTGLRDLVRRLEDTEDDLRRVQQKACSTAEALRLNSQRLDAVLADRESERAARTAEEKRTRTAEAVLARVRQMADYWEQQLPDVIRTPAVVSALRAVLDQAHQPTT